MTEPRSDSFAWMLDRHQLRRSLPTIGRAVRRGGINAAPAGHRLALVDSLEALLDAPDLTNREVERLARLLAAIDPDPSESRNRSFSALPSGTA